MCRTIVCSPAEGTVPLFQVAVPIVWVVPSNGTLFGSPSLRSKSKKPPPEPVVQAPPMLLYRARSLLGSELVYTQYSIKPGIPPTGLSFVDLNEYVAMPLALVKEALTFGSSRKTPFLLLSGQPLSVNE